MELDQQIAKAIEWIEESNKLIEGSPVPTTERARASTTLLHLSLEHCHGIISLVEQEIYGSACALLRPQLEAFVCGIWFHGCAQEKQVKSFLKDGRQPPRFGCLIKEVEQLERYKPLSKIKKEIWPLLNDYTHGWIHQVIARNTKNEIVSAYDPEDVARTVRLSIGLALAASAGIAMNVNDTEYTELENKLKALYQNIYGIAL